MNLDDFENFVISRKREVINHGWNGVWGWSKCAIGEFCRSQGFEPDDHTAYECDYFAIDLLAELREFAPGTFEALNTAGVADYEDLALVLKAERCGRITYDDFECCGFNAREIIEAEGL